jgi:Skp family chaperone for outer membrane proteins
MKKTLSIALIASALVISGCQESNGGTAAPAAESSVGTVAVFDIDKVADETGMVQEMNKKMKERAVQLRKDLQEFHKKLKGELEKQAKKLDPKEKNFRQKVAALEQGAQIKFRQTQAQADQALNVYRIKQISEIRELIKPVAKEVASSKGFTILLLRNDTVVFDAIDPVELTDEILASYQGKHPEAVKKPEPEAEGKQDDAAPSEAELKAEEQAAEAAEAEKAAEADKTADVVKAAKADKTAEPAKEVVKKAVEAKATDAAKAVEKKVQ